VTSIDRTAYPRFANHLSQREIQVRYAVTDEERLFIFQASKGASGRLTLAVLLKTRQQLGYFPDLADVPRNIKAHLATILDDPENMALSDAARQKPTRTRYRLAIRTFLHCRPYIDDGPSFINPIVTAAAHTMSDPADLINIAIDELVKANIDLPAFSTLDRLINHLRQQVHEEIFIQATESLIAPQRAVLDGLLRLTAGERLTGFTRLKQSPGTPTITRIREWSDRLDWLTALLDPTPFLKDIAFTKIRQFAAEASANEISDIRNTRNERRRHTLLLCLLHQAQTQARDDLVKMFFRRMKKTENAAKEKLGLLQQDHRAVEESLIAAFARVWRSRRCRGEQ
jgi:hypothetical protein